MLAAARLVRGLGNADAHVEFQPLARRLISAGVPARSLSPFVLAHLPTTDAGGPGDVRSTGDLIRLYDFERRPLLEVVRLSGLSKRTFFERRREGLEALGRSLIAASATHARFGIPGAATHDTLLDVLLARARTLSGLGVRDVATRELDAALRRYPVGSASARVRLELATAAGRDRFAATAHLDEARAVIAELDSHDAERMLLEAEVLVAAHEVGLGPTHELEDEMRRFRIAAATLIDAGHVRALGIFVRGSTLLVERSCLHGHYERMHRAARVVRAALRESPTTMRESSLRVEIMHAWARLQNVEDVPDAWNDLQHLFVESVREGLMRPIALCATLLAQQSWRSDDLYGAAENARIAFEAAGSDAELAAIAASSIAMVDFVRGDARSARRGFATARRIARGTPTLESEIDFRQMLSRQHARRYDAALSQLDAIAPSVPDPMVDADFLGAIFSARAECLSRLQHEREARSAIGTAVDLLGARGSRYVLGATFERAARITGDRRFRTALADLASAPHTLNQDHLRGLETFRVPENARAKSWRAVLTEREHEVARLVAQGLTNVEVAARLRISHKTVGHHVESILGKLDLHSRRGLMDAPEAARSSRHPGVDAQV